MKRADGRGCYTIGGRPRLQISCLDAKCRDSPSPAEPMGIAGIVSIFRNSSVASWRVVPESVLTTEKISCRQVRGSSNDGH